jgi:hypothetical protein
MLIFLAYLLMFSSCLRLRRNEDHQIATTDCYIDAIGLATPGSDRTGTG